MPVLDSTLAPLPGVDAQAQAPLPFDPPPLARKAVRRRPNGGIYRGMLWAFLIEAAILAFAAFLVFAWRAEHF